jgi:CBS domain-containing protein
MSSIREVVRDREIFTVEAEDTVFAAARFMHGHNIGAVPVLSRGELVGVFSERDVVTRVMLEGRDPNKTPVGEVMTCDPQVVDPEESAERCLIFLKQGGFRHLPVVRDGALVGFLSMRDLLLHDIDEKEVEVRMMRAYMNGGAGD